MDDIPNRKQIGGQNPPFSLAFLSCVGYYGYIYIIAILTQINALQVRPKSSKLERLQGLENQPGKVRQKRKTEHARTNCEIEQKPGIKFDSEKITAQI